MTLNQAELAKRHEELEKLKARYENLVEAYNALARGDADLACLNLEDEKDLIAQLGEKGVEKIWRDKFGNSKLLLGIMLGRMDHVDREIAHRRTLNTKNYAGQAPLHEAVSRGRLDIIKQLLDAEANINIQDDAGNTPLHVAAYDYNLEPKVVIGIARYLVEERHANVLIQNNEGLTPSGAAENSTGILSVLCDNYEREAMPRMIGFLRKKIAEQIETLPGPTLPDRAIG